MDKQDSEIPEQDAIFISIWDSIQEEADTLNDDNEQREDVHDTISYLLQQAQEHQKRQQWEDASKHYLKILAREPDHEEALEGLAWVYDHSNQFEPLYEVTQLLLEHAAHSDKKALGLAYKARALQKMERISEAKIANDQALLLNTNLGLAWINRGGLQLLQQKFPEALRSTQRAIELAPDDARAWANKGTALANFNRLSEALDAFDRSLQLDDYQIFALQMKANILCRIGRMKEVLPLVRKALQLNPFDITAVTQGIQATRTLEHYEAMRELSTTMIQLIPNGLFGWEHYVRSLRGLARFEEANTALDQLLTFDGANVRFITMKADTLYRLERYRDAANLAEKARQIDPDYFPANRLYDKALRLMYLRKEKKKSED